MFLVLSLHLFHYSFLEYAVFEKFHHNVGVTERYFHYGLCKASRAPINCGQWLRELETAWHWNIRRIAKGPTLKKANICDFSPKYYSPASEISFWKSISELLIMIRIVLIYISMHLAIEEPPLYCERSGPEFGNTSPTRNWIYIQL